MEWPIIILIILGIFIFIKVISKIVRILIGIGLVVLILHFITSTDFAMVMISHVRVM